MTIALPARLVQHDRRADRHVEAVGDAPHRQVDGRDVRPAPGVGQALVLGAQDDGHRDRSGRPRCTSTDASTRVVTMRTSWARSQARTSSLEAAATGSAKTVPALARMTLGLARSVRGEAAMTAVRAGAVGAAQDRADVARLLDAFEDDEQRVVGQGQRVRGPAPARRTTATRPSDRSPKASLRQDRRADPLDRACPRRPGRRARRGHPRRPRRRRGRTPRRPRRRRRAPGAARARRRRGSGRSRPFAALAQGDGGLDPRVGRARDDGRVGHGRPARRA